MKTMKLGDICELFADGDWIESKDQSYEGIRIIQTGNVGNGLFKNKDTKARYINQETFNKLRCTEIFPGDLLVSRLPEPVGRACIIPETNEKMVTAVDCTIIRVKRDLIDVNFLAYFLQSNNYFQQVEKLCGGATRKRISRKNLSTIRVPLPSLEEQRRVVERLDVASEKINQAIELTEINKLNQVALQIRHLNESFSTFNDTVKIGDVFRTSSGGTPLKSNKDFYDGGDIPWLMSGEVNKRDIFDSKNYISQKGLEGSSAKLFPENTVLVAMYGATAGQVGILRFEASTNQAVCGILPNDRYIPEYLFYFLSSIKKSLIAQAVGNAQPNISQQKIKSIEIPQISFEDQRRVVERLDVAFEKINRANSLREAKLKRLHELKQSMLQQAFSGDGVQ